MNALRHLVSLGAMVGGTLGVVGLLIWMNNAVTAPAKAPRKPGVDLKVAPPPPPPKSKPKPKPKPKPRPKQARKAPPRSLAPNLGSALSGIDLGGFGGGSPELNTSAESLLGAAQEDLVMTEDAVDTPPRPVSRAPAQYPPAARARGTSGFVTLDLLIDQNGSVAKAKVRRAEPAGIFEQSAIAAARRYRFSPAQYKGAPTRVWARQTIHFKLARATGG